MASKSVLVLSFLSLAAAPPAWSQITNSPPPGISASELATEIERAAADQPYGVSLRLSEPTPVAEIRTVSTQLAIPRVLAMVKYADYVGGPPRAIQVLSLGEMYASGAGRYWECRALIGASFGENELRHLPIDEWPVSELNVYATAHVIRELLSGRLLPPMTIVGGGPGRPQDQRILEESVQREIAQPLENPQHIDLPADCSQFIGSIDAPTLSRDFPRGFEYPEALPGEDFRAHAFRVLGQLPRDTAVTIDLKLAFGANVDVLASLVREYDVAGMRAGLVPVRSTEPITADAELSTHGDRNAQIHRVRCGMRIGIGGVEPQASSEWYADWIDVSLSTDNAALFLSYPKVAQARVSGAHPIAELDRLRDYFEKLATKVYEMPKSIVIPPGCEDIFVHNDQEEVGGIRGFPID